MSTTTQHRHDYDEETGSCYCGDVWDENKVPQPAPDANGEWFMEAEPVHGHRIVDKDAKEIVGNIYREDHAAQIVSDHNSVIKLLTALHDARHRIGVLEREISARGTGE